MRPCCSTFLLGTALLAPAYAGVHLRQNTAPLVLVPQSQALSTSSFNWWPYPPEGSSSSTPTTSPMLILPLPSTPSTTIPITTSSLDATSAATSAPSTSSNITPTSTLIQVTALTSIPASASPSSGPPTPYRPHDRPLNKLWFIPLCLIAGAALGCAAGWVCARLWEKRTRTNAATESHALLHHTDKEIDSHPTAKDLAPDVERANVSPAPGLGPLRMPSHASTSGARTWVARAQARKRSGAGIRLTSASRARGWGHVSGDGDDIAASPLLSPEYGEPKSVPEPLTVPASSHQSSYPYGDEEEGDYEKSSETPRGDKSISQRLLERLGLSSAEPSKGRGMDVISHTWNGKQMERAAFDKGHSMSLLGPKASQKRRAERVEKWLRDVAENPGTTMLKPPSKDSRTALGVDLDMSERNADDGSPLAQSKRLSTLQKLRTSSARSLSESQDAGVGVASKLRSKFGHKILPISRSTPRHNSPVKDFSHPDLAPHSSGPGANSQTTTHRPVTLTDAAPSIARPTSIQPPSSGLPAGPPFVMSPPLQSELAFEETPRTPRNQIAGPFVVGNRRRISDLQLDDGPPPSLLSRVRSPKDRYLARQSANARVDMILSRSYSSREFSEGVSSPYMFGASIDKPVGMPRVNETQLSGRGSQRDEQRLQIDETHE